MPDALPPHDLEDPVDGLSPATGAGTERPETLPPTGGPIELERTFSFIDICGFTALTERQGIHLVVRDDHHRYSEAMLPSLEFFPQRGS